MEEVSDCRWDSVSVTFGATVDDDGVHSSRYDFCGYYTIEEDDDICEEYGSECQPLPEPITSMENTMLVKFQTDSSTIEGRGFKAHWELGCGGTYIQPGRIVSPYYPNPYPKSKSCQYHINGVKELETAQAFIALAFEDFILGGADANCSNVFVEVYDGKGTDDELLLRACGTNMPPEVHSTADHMLIVFQTDGNAEDKGFAANFDFLKVGCGGFYNASTDGAIISPAFPEPYPSNLDCFYYIVADNGYILTLEFMFFELEDDGDCDYDFVKVFYSDRADEAALVGTYCGMFPDATIPPGKFISPDRYITVELFTDDSFNGGGFTADYRQLKKEEVCGETIIRPSGTITSPEYPSNYGADLHCQWHLQVRAGVLIEINFTDFMLEHSDGCMNDYVELYDGKTDQSHVIGRYCGYGQDHDVPRGIIKGSTNLMTVKFVTNDFIETKGFTANFEGTEEGCGGVLKATSGVVHSPNYPSPYPNDANCEEWF